MSVYLRVFVLQPVMFDTVHTDYGLDEMFRFIQLVNGFHGAIIQKPIDYASSLAYDAFSGTEILVEYGHEILEQITDVLPGIIAGVLDFLAGFSHVQLFCFLVLLLVVFGMNRISASNRKLLEEMKLCGNDIKNVKWQKDMSSEEIKEFEDRLNKNKENRIPHTLANIENLYKLLEKKISYKHQLESDLNFWGPEIMAQQQKIRRLNTEWDKQDNKGDLRDLGRHVDIELRRIKQNLSEMTNYAQRELTILDSME